MQKKFAGRKYIVYDEVMKSLKKAGKTAEALADFIREIGLPTTLRNFEHFQRMLLIKN